MSPQAEAMQRMIMAIGFSEEECPSVALILREVLLHPGLPYANIAGEFLPLLNRLLVSGLILKSASQRLTIRPGKTMN